MAHLLLYGAYRELRRDWDLIPTVPEGDKIRAVEVRDEHAFVSTNDIARRYERLPCLTSMHQTNFAPNTWLATLSRSDSGVEQDESLGLTGFEELRPRLESYLASIAGYRKNRLDGLPELLRHRISHDWGRSFDE
jgi:hypothetical protein